MTNPVVRIDFGMLRNLTCGLGQTALNYAQQLVQLPERDVLFDFIVPQAFVGRFGEGVRYTPTNYLNRHVQLLIPSVPLWHCTHQFPQILPWRSTKMILTIHDLNFLYEQSPARSAKMLSKLQAMVNKTTYITVISEFTRMEVESHLDLGNKPIQVIYNGVPTPAAAPQHAPAFVLEGKPFFFSIGQMHEKKNFHTLLDMMKHWPSHQLYLCGEAHTAYGQHLAQRIANENLINVHLTGPISEADKAWLYQHCLAFLFPSRLEGFGLPVIEAMLYQRPVVTSKLTSLAEIGGDYAYFWHEFSPQHMTQVLREAINHFYSNPTVATQQLIYAQSYNYQSYAKNYLDLYKSLLTAF